MLDTCEHVIGAAAALAEAALRAGRALHLLATSREPLRAEGEWVYPVPPLAVPAEDAEDADDLLRYGGVCLFVERLRAAEPHFASDRRSAAMIAASVGGSTASRWRSSWRRRAPPSSELRRSPHISTIVSGS